MHVRRVMLVSVVVGLFIAQPTRGHAGDTHYEDFRFGQTALGFGGAVTGFLTEPEAAYYNPGGLAFLERSIFSGAINFIGEDKMVVRDWISFDQPGLPERDGVSKDFLSLPTSSVAAHSFSDGRFVVTFSTFLESNVEESITDTLDFDFISERHTMTENFYDTLVLTGPSFGMRISEGMGLGLSVFYARRESSQLDLLAIRSIEEVGGMPVGYEEVTEKVDIDDGALLARLGWMWKPTSRWSLGAALSTESVRLHGSGVRASRLIDALHKDDEESDRYLEAVQRGRARSRYPWSLALGASNGVEGRWRIAMNLNLYLPVAYTRISFTQSPLERGVSSSFTPRITRELTVNTSVGGEFYIGERWPLRAGFFTNHSSAPEIVNAVVAEPQLPHVDLYGAALSLGYKGDNSSINFGVELQLGKGRETTLNSDLEFAAQNPYSRRVRERSRVLFFISGAVSFVSERASKIIKEDKADPETAKEPDDLEEEAQPSP